MTLTLTLTVALTVSGELSARSLRACFGLFHHADKAEDEHRPLTDAEVKGVVRVKGVVGVKGEGREGVTRRMMARGRVCFGLFHHVQVEDEKRLVVLTLAFALYPSPSSPRSYSHVNTRTHTRAGE